MYLNQEKNFRSLFENISRRQFPLSVAGITNSAGAYFAAQIYLALKKTVIIVTATSKEAERCVDEIRFFVGTCSAAKVFYFPAYNVSPSLRLAYHNEIASKRVACLYRLLNSNSEFIVVTTVRGFSQKLIPKEVLLKYVKLIMVGEKIGFDYLIKKLSYGGYTLAVLVEEPGDFSVRNSIIDVFLPLYDRPVRIEFFNDTVESIRLFSLVDQRTFKYVKEVVILPAREFVMEKEKLSFFVGCIRKRAIEQGMNSSHVKKIAERIKKGSMFFRAMEVFSPLLYGSMDSIFDYLPVSSIILTMNRLRIARDAISFDKEMVKNFEEVVSSDGFSLKPRELFLSWPTIEFNLAINKSVDFELLGVSNSDFFPFYVNSLSNSDVFLKESRNKSDSILFLLSVLEKNRSSGYTTVVVCDSEKQINRIIEIMLLHEVNFVYVKSFFNISDGLFFVCLGKIYSGFVISRALVSVITYEEIFGTRGGYKKHTNRKSEYNLIDFGSLKKGDLVVHHDHGIGQYYGLKKIKIDKVINDFLSINYKNGDRFYLPVDRMGLIHKYMGVGDVIPELDKMGGKLWSRVKEKVRLSAEKITEELVQVSAERRIRSGCSLSCADHVLMDFASQFQYEETPDQLRAIDDVLNDMRKIVPMDRLVCGDVGYGKTEVALRAAFVAVNEAKQVAILVPTTVLAEQHFSTFCRRFKGYSVRIACLSRFKSRIEQRELILNIKQGFVDIVIGTHRLLQNDVVFMELGLLILDEEQRFGVRHKEKLKKLRTSVDVLALTATPIPRTLHLSLMGIRDISIISTPPEQRRSIMTYICEFDDSIIIEAIRNELSRNGQIFFVHNDIRSISRIAKHIKNCVPEVRLGIAHGQMDEDSLGNVMISFTRGEIDLLVCTTIIESGIDVAGANTIILNRADRFGLAQIYQLRGRVGRSDEQAYAYFFVPGENILGDKAAKRLKVLMEHSDLGSGFNIAMSDLKIRGGGTIIGASQSGHVAAVGYEMFLKLMEESVAKLKGKTVPNNLEPEINIPISAFISEDYVSDIDQRLVIYRRLSKVRNLENLADIRREILDRYGVIPEETKNLLLKIMLRVLAVRAGAKKINMTGKKLIIHFSRIHQKKPSGIFDILIEENKNYKLIFDDVFMLEFTSDVLLSRILEVKNVLIEIAHCVSE